MKNTSTVNCSKDRAFPPFAFKVLLRVFVFVPLGSLGPIGSWDFSAIWLSDFIFTPRAYV